jgi:hypothetical protein
MTETRRSSWKGTAARAAALAGCFAFAAGGAAWGETPLQLTYRVSHSMFGDIGTYSNTIEPTADGTKVKTQAHFEVKMLGMGVYREDAQRTEHWKGNRLVGYHSVTRKGDKSTEVSGEARGNSFVITSPEGTVAAPATVHPANPWSANFIGSSTMMRPDTGQVEQVRISGGNETAVTIAGSTIPVRKYEVDGKNRYTVWLDRRGLPVEFVADDDSGKVTFTLDKCDRCNLDVSYLTPK